MNSAAFRSEPLTCIVCEVNMPKMTGLELQVTLQQQSNLAFVTASRPSGALEAVTAFSTGGIYFFLKPIDAGQFNFSGAGFGSQPAVQRSRTAPC